MRPPLRLIIPALLSAPSLLLAESWGPYVPIEEEDLTKTTHEPQLRLVEPFTAYSLAENEWKIGRDLDMGWSDDFMVGTKLVSMLVGAPTIQAKHKVTEFGNHAISVGLTLAYFNRDTFLWFNDDTKENFETLNAKIARPSISWSNSLSDRLNLHTYWGVGFGQANAKLSPKGERALWESKHPGGNWETRQETEDTIDTENNSSSTNQETRQQPNSVSRTKLLEIQQLTEVITNIFQITGELERENGKRVLVSTSVEQAEIEKLKSESFQILLAQQWILDKINFRLGLGVQYQVISGEDLDGEKIEDTGFLPAADIDFYYRF